MQCRTAAAIDRSGLLFFLQTHRRSFCLSQEEEEVANGSAKTISSICLEDLMRERIFMRMSFFAFIEPASKKKLDHKLCDEVRSFVFASPPRRSRLRPDRFIGCATEGRVANIPCPGS